MTRAMRTLTERCISGITVNENILDDYLQRSIGVVTALVPVIGYAAATDVASTALETGRPVSELVLERDLLDETRLQGLLSTTSRTRTVRPTRTGHSQTLEKPRPHPPEP